MHKRRTRKDWYEYHLEQSQQKEKELVKAQYGYELKTAKNYQQAVSNAYENARKNEPLASFLQSLVGIDSEYRKSVLAPLKSDDRIARRALSDAWERHSNHLKEVEKRGTEKYRSVHQARKLEAEVRAERVAKRKYERRLRYLEQSPAIRSASRPLKDHLVAEQSQDGENIVCYYCNQVIPIGESNLEHKRPISRGVTNSRGNLVLACATCNLRKGKKTQDEFLKHLGMSAS